MKKNIFVKGARTHNLKNINLEIPRNKLVTITGPLLLLIQSLQKDNEDIWNHYPHMLDNS